MIFQLLYVSEESKNYKSGDLDSIIEKSQMKNKKNDITGILIKNGQFFLQLLEGKKETVMDTFYRISGDDRHYHVRNLLSASSPERFFPNWSMGLVERPPEGSMNVLMPYLHGKMIEEGETKAKILAAIRSFNRLELKSV